jgi:hypothetical protein
MKTLSILRLFSMLGLLVGCFVFQHSARKAQRAAAECLEAAARWGSIATNSVEIAERAVRISNEFSNQVESLWRENAYLTAENLKYQFRDIAAKAGTTNIQFNFILHDAGTNSPAGTNAPNKTNASPRKLGFHGA